MYHLLWRTAATFSFSVVLKTVIWADVEVRVAAVLVPSRGREFWVCGDSRQKRGYSTTGWSGQGKTLLILHVVKMNVIWRSSISCCLSLQLLPSMDCSLEGQWHLQHTSNLQTQNQEETPIFRNPRKLCFGQMAYWALPIPAPFPISFFNNSFTVIVWMATFLHMTLVISLECSGACVYFY